MNVKVNLSDLCCKMIECFECIDIKMSSLPGTHPFLFAQHQPNIYYFTATIWPRAGTGMVVDMFLSDWLYIVLVRQCVTTTQCALADNTHKHVCSGCSGHSFRQSCFRFGVFKVL